MFKIIFLLSLLFTSYSAFAQPEENEVILTIDDRRFYKDEFTRLYEKNNQNLQNQSEKKRPEQYMDLFINYKLKVMEAERLKMDTLPGFKKEYQQFRKELILQFRSLAISEEMIETAYDRVINELKVSHILIGLPMTASPQDTLTAWSQIMDIRKQITSGADFNDMAMKYSQDPSVRQNKGMIGYFRGFQVIFPFEDAAYKTPVGELSMPVRTPFGYHLIRVHNKRMPDQPVRSLAEMRDELIVRIRRNMEFNPLHQFSEQKDDFSEEKYPEFSQLMQEFRDGILLFNLSEELVWERARTDSSGLQSFYNKNKGRYSGDEQFSGWVIQCKTQEVRDFADEMISADSRISKEEMEDRLNLEYENQAHILKGNFSKGENPLVDYFVWDGPEPAGYRDGLHFINGNKTVGGPKSLEEARGLYLSGFQDFLEAEWVKQLRKKYKIKVNRNILKTVKPV
ncbi:peptidylprolyl isomerase [Gaoshiqia sp. Z1-71]|uniref:peptidylprolyl isomerase n=1 Tax=Gaoshiqia hydrogeniformans TaxID=3290090 RepID=UPI003BF7D347